MEGQSNIEYFWSSFWDIATWLKLLLLFATSRWWFPSIRSLWRELQEVLAPGGGMFGRNQPRPIATRPFHDDPFVNIPLASYRSGLRSGQRAAQPERQREIVPALRKGGARSPAARSSATGRTRSAPKLVTKRGF